MSIMLVMFLLIYVHVCSTKHIKVTYADYYAEQLKHRIDCMTVYLKSYSYTVQNREFMLYTYALL